MKADNVVAEKSMDFAVRIVRLCKYLSEERHERVLSNQLLRSGTSIGANISEALYGQSRADFCAKMTIALKEASETSYWLRLLVRTETMRQDEYEDIAKYCDELIRLLIAIVKSAKEQR